MLRKIALGVVLATIAATASAKPTESCKIDWLFGFIPIEVCTPKDHHPKTAVAPEIDPASAMAGLTLMAGGLVVLRGRRKKNIES